MKEVIGNYFIILCKKIFSYIFFYFSSEIPLFYQDVERYIAVVDTLDAEQIAIMVLFCLFLFFL